MHKIILDRSIFHGDRFEQIRRSRLLERSRKNKLRIYFTPVFIEESLQLSLLRKSEFEDHIEFLFSLNSSRWFKAPSEILLMELSGETLPSMYYLINKKDIQTCIGNCRDFVRNTTSTIPELESVKVDIKKNNELKNEFRAKRLEMRREVPHGNYDFNEYFENSVDWFIENGLMKYHPGTDDYLKRWKSERHRFRFTEQYIRAWFATILVPVINHNVKIDRNDRGDAEQLAFLHWTDIIVSEDTQFMQEAFDLLFSGKGKRLMKLDEFLLFVDKL